MAIQKFARDLPDSRLLEACGFESAPTRQTIDSHFAALERSVEAFEQVAYELIGHARGVEPRIGVNVFVDSTAFRSPSGLQHACDDAVACAKAGGMSSGRLREASVDEAKERHFRECEMAEELVEKLTATASGTRGGIVAAYNQRGLVQLREIFLKRGGRQHRYLTRDLSSGARSYDDVGKFWFRRLPAGRSRHVHAPADLPVRLPCRCDRAGRLLRALRRDGRSSWDAASRRLGRSWLRAEGLLRIQLAPRCRGCRPFRKRIKGEELSNRRTDAFDEHGVPRCQHCGGPGDQLSPGLGPTFNRAGEPFIRFRCLLQPTRDCRQTQRLRCAIDWVQLPLLPQESALFHAVRYAHHNKEGNFDADRHRYAIAGKDGLGRLRRTGIDAQRLRCAAAMLLNWFKVSLRHGWLDPHELEVSLNQSAPVRLSTLHDGSVGVEELHKLHRYRDEQNLELPYGSAAGRLSRAYQELA